MGSLSSTQFCVEQRTLVESLSGNCDSHVADAMGQQRPCPNIADFLINVLCICFRDEAHAQGTVNCTSNTIGLPITDAVL